MLQLCSNAVGSDSMTKMRKEDLERRRSEGRSRDFLEVLHRSMRVIEGMGAGGEALTLSDIARLTDLPRPSVKRILHTLTDLGYVAMVGRTFRLTPKIVRLATSFLGASGNSRVLQSTCEDLSSATGHSCLAGVLDDSDVLVVAYSISKRLMAPFLGVGVRFPAFCSAAGRILLGELNDDALDDFLERLDPSAQTDATILDKGRIKDAILLAREQGFSEMEDEYISGWRTVAYPLRRHDNSLLGAISLNCKKSPALTEVDFKRFSALCAETADGLRPVLVH